MRQTLKFIVLILFCVAGALLFVRRGRTQTQPPKTAAEVFKNIQVLNAMPADQMGKVMNLMSASLGVNCNFCHAENDFAKEGFEHKDAARAMLKMTFELNKNFFNGRPEVSCNTCHNGRAHPQSAPNLFPAAPEPRPKQPDVRPTVEAILDHYAQAVGGRTNAAKIISRTITAVRVEPDGTSEPEEIRQKADKLLIATRYPQTVVTEIFDGVRARKLAGSSTITLKPDEAEQIKRNAQIFAVTDLRTIYSKMEYRFTDKIDGRAAHLVIATTADNSRERLYFDAESGLLVRRVAATPTVLGAFSYQVDYRNYKDFGGVKLPTTISFAVPNIRWTRKITDVKINAPVDDARFNPPVK